MGLEQNEVHMNIYSLLHRLLRAEFLWEYIGTFAAFIDFQKAYDSICHHLLWEKLKLCGISGVYQCRFYKCNTTSELRISHHTTEPWSPAGLCFATNSFQYLYQRPSAVTGLIVMLKVSFLAM